MSNTLLRVEFGFKFAQFTLYATSIKKINFIVTDFHRTEIQQKKKFDEKKSLCDGHDKVSFHQKWRAKDLVIIDKNGNPIWGHTPAYDILAEIWKALGGRWGGDWYKQKKTKFDDCYHFEF